MPGVTDINIVFATESLRLNYDPQQVSEKAIFDRIKALGYTIEQTTVAIIPSEDSGSSTVETTQKTNSTNWEFWIRNRRGQTVILAGLGLVMGLLTQHLALPIWLSRGFYGIGIIVAGFAMPAPV